MIRRARVPLIVLAIVAASHAAPGGGAGANELQANGASSGLVIHGPEQTLHDYCSSDSAGRLWLALPGGARYELITSTADPAIYNPGDGAFHPFEESEVRETLAALRFPIAGIGADIFLLPYPRRVGLESAAGAGLVLLAPGVRPLSAEQQHAELTHELGHVVHRALMPDSSSGAWGAYRAMRGIVDPTVYSASALHANRPHEIFAEDFRALFGDALANYSGTVENASIPPPSQVAGLQQFLLELTGARQLALAALPNPARGAMQFDRAGGAAVMLDVFDAQGRGVATLAPSRVGNGVRWSWDGRDRNGTAAAGVFYARPRDGSRAAVRFTRLR